LELTSLSGPHSLAEHMLSITQTTGTGSFIASELEIEIMEINLELSEPIEVVLTEEIEIAIENEIEVEIC